MKQHENWVSRNAIDRGGGLHLAAEILQDALRGHREWAVQGAAAGIFMTAPAKSLGDAGHVHPPLAAQAEANVVIAQFAQKHSNFDALR